MLATAPQVRPESRSRPVEILEAATLDGLQNPAGMLKLFSPWRKLIVPPSGKASTWQDVYTFWFGEISAPAANYNLMFGCGPKVDQVMRQVFEPLWKEALDGGLKDWEEQPKSLVAKVLLTDQFPRHMFRGTPDAYRSDELARRLADRCVELLGQGAKFHVEELLIIAFAWLHDERVETVQLFQDWVETLAEKLKGTSYPRRMWVHHNAGKAHVTTVARFGRYPHRNRILGRPSTVDEEAHMKAEAEGWEKDQSAEGRGGTKLYARGVRDHSFKAAKELWGDGHYEAATAAFFGAFLKANGYTGGL